MKIEKSLIKRIGIYLVLGIILYSLDYSGEEFGGLILFIFAVIFATLFYIVAELIHETKNQNSNYNRLEIWGIVSIIIGLLQLIYLYIYHHNSVSFILNFFNEFIGNFYLSDSDNIFNLLFPVLGFNVYFLAREQKKSTKYFFVFLKVALIFAMINFYLIVSQDMQINRENIILSDLNTAVESLDVSKCRDDQGYSKDRCMNEIAQKTQNADLCPNTRGQAPCITNIAIKTKNYETCLKIKILNDGELFINSQSNVSVAQQFGCLLGIVRQTHEEKICEIIKKTEIKNEEDHNYFIKQCEDTINDKIQKSY